MTLPPPPSAALRNLHYDAKSAAKVALIVQPGDTLTVSDDIADQLVAASSQFKVLDDAPAAKPAPKAAKKPAPKDA